MTIRKIMLLDVCTDVDNKLALKPMTQPPEFRSDLAELLKRHCVELEADEDGQSYEMNRSVCTITMYARPYDKDEPQEEFAELVSKAQRPN